MILVPMRLETSSAMAGWPPTRANPVGSLKVRRAKATSRKASTRSPLVTTGSESMSCAVSSSPGTFTGKRPCPVSIAPAATSWLLRATVASRTSGLWSRLSRSPGSTSTSTRSSRSPATSASSTPGSPSSLSRRFRAWATSARSETSPYRVTTMTGKSATLTSCTVGSSVSSGSSVLATSTCSRTSSSA